MATDIYEEVRASGIIGVLADPISARALSSYLDELEARISDAKDAVSHLGDVLIPLLSEDEPRPEGSRQAHGRSGISRRVEDLIEEVCDIEARVRNLSLRVDL